MKTFQVKQIAVKYKVKMELSEPLTYADVVADLCRKLIADADEDVEQFIILAVNLKARLIGYNIQSGCDDKVVVDRKHLARFLLLAGASGFFICHTHKHNCTPSSYDDGFTKLICDLAAILDIRFYDHIILDIFSNNYYSYAQHGWSNGWGRNNNE